ncbi:hypothetical protein [Micromonospora sp. DH14]|uniref:hypothetical protein n=1 Tax=Micromonospora sp. DH14 TaxID=3040120 RepID=UPI002442C526|nr:hypothetical protein [Micromonospora sp. DH14]MDG9673034.1 hypothetical protein [Micromonospora sp. DH14]
MDAHEERILAGANQIANAAREVITGSEAGQGGDMWSMVYGGLHVETTSVEQLVEVFSEHYNALNQGAMALVVALAQIHASATGTPDVEVIDQAQALIAATMEA